MAFSKEGFFKIFQSDLRPVLQRFFENRRTRITVEMANEWADSGTFARLATLELIEIDAAAGEYRLDDRIERFLEEMLGASEVVQSDWLVALLEEIRRNIEAYQKLSDPHKGTALLRRICRLLHACKTRSQRHLEEVKAAVDYDYRAGSDYEVKLYRLEWHLDRTRSYGKAIDELNTLLRHDTFFQVHQEIEIVSLRRQVLHSCAKVGDALIDVYQCIEDYLNRVQRDYARTRKLIRLCGLLDRHEHLTATNIADVATKATGPWFHEFRVRTSLDPTILDTRPELLLRVLAREGIGPAASKPKELATAESQTEDTPVIDWQDVYDAFSRQKEDLFVFLGKVRVEGRPLTEEERIDGYCAILTNEDWLEAWENHPFEVGTDGTWEYAIVPPPALSMK